MTLAPPGYDLLGMVSIQWANHTDADDPLSPKNRDVLRRNACAMGGEFIAVSTMGDGGGLYLVLRPHLVEPPPSAPTQL
jgi:hypothetical protein